MKNSGIMLAVLAAFVAGSSLCAFTVFQDKSSASAPVLPDRSVVPRFDFATVEASYAAIPHRRTVFPRPAAGIAERDADYLRLMFDLMDQSIVVRVNALSELSAGRSAAEHLAAYDELIQCAEAIPAPDMLEQYHEAIRAALATQRGVVQSLHRQTVLGTTEGSIHSTPGVRKSSALLKKAYAMLMATFPASDQTTQKAFFDYHCALDFI